jgi:hypothetical protein
MLRAAVTKGSILKSSTVSFRPIVLGVQSALRVPSYWTPGNARISMGLQNQSTWRCLSSDTGKSGNDNKGGETTGEDRKDIVLTPGQKVVAASRATMWIGILAFASVCGFYIVKELLPT